MRAKADTKATHTVDYRSFDRAGNREPKKSCEVNIDRTSTADDDVPGVVLPPSPIAGDAGWWVDDYDVYAVDLDAGQSLKAVATALPGTWPELSLHPAGVASVNGVQALASSDLTVDGSALVACVEESGTYYLSVGGTWPPTAHELTWEVVPAGVDVTAPFVALKGGGLPYWYWGETKWVNHATRLNLAAVDDPLGSGVARIETSLDEGLTWTPGAFPVIPAPADHSNDGLHTIYYRAVDAAGNASLAESGVVAIDTQGPMTETWAPSKAVRRGGRCWIPHADRRRGRLHHRGPRDQVDRDRRGRRDEVGTLVRHGTRLDAAQVRLPARRLRCAARRPHARLGRQPLDERCHPPDVARAVGGGGNGPAQSGFTFAKDRRGHRRFG